ncbi:MAG TPA: hypothetical protein VKD90_22355 [Gemmataceae bacterium]|nr:hypothetical protein [Gemmataceae bacterium]
MGVLYIVEPLDAEIREWLSEEGVALPRGRNPTPAEIRAVCDALDGFRVKYIASTKKKFWQAVVEGRKGRDRERWTILNIEKWGGSEDRRYQILFDKGDPALILEIVRALTAPCGPLVVIPDTGDTPIVLWPEADPEELMRAWE